jgi:hypothetical protein
MLDRGHSREVMTIAKESGLGEIVTQRPHKFHGNSFNVLDGYARALERAGDKPIHLIEEDIFIGEGYFHFHEAAWRVDPEAFFVTACLNQNHKDRPKDGDWSAVYRYQSYQSLGVSLKPESVRQFIHHNNPHYLRNFNSYLDKHFGKMAYGGEQDGLIQRVIVKGNHYGIYPHVQRAFHAGFRGYNRKGKELDRTMPMKDRINALVHMSEKEMNDRASNVAHKDIERCPSGYFEPESLYLAHGLH